MIYDEYNFFVDDSNYTMFLGKYFSSIEKAQEAITFFSKGTLLQASIELLNHKNFFVKIDENREMMLSSVFPNIIKTFPLNLKIEELNPLQKAAVITRCSQNVSALAEETISLASRGLVLEGYPEECIKFLIDNVDNYLEVLINCILKQKFVSFTQKTIEHTNNLSNGESKCFISKYVQEIVLRNIFLNVEKMAIFFENMKEEERNYLTVRRFCETKNIPIILNNFIAIAKINNQLINNSSTFQTSLSSVMEWIYKELMYSLPSGKTSFPFVDKIMTHDLANEILNSNIIELSNLRLNIKDYLKDALNKITFEKINEPQLL